MTYEEINEMMQEIGMPFAYHHFAEGESPKPPFVIFLSPGEDTFGADNLMYHSFKQLDVELYTDEKSPDNIIRCYDSVPEMLRYDFNHAEEWHSVSMRR